MRIRVTAVLVAREGGEWLDETIAGLAAQTRAPDRIIAVSNGGAETVAKQLAVSGAERIVSTGGVLPFGLAVQHAIMATGVDQPALHPLTAAAQGGQHPGGQAPNPADTGALQADWLWLLTEDSAPEPGALEEMLSTVQRSPSVAVAGPKLVDWHDPGQLIELGQSLTRTGERWLLKRQELDQQQYDHLQDVLGVGPVGMLVRQDVWRELGGFDPALPVYDDGLDFSVRARLAGHRVVVAPAARLRFAQRGVAGPRIDRSRRVLRVAHRQGRTAYLHRRIAYAPGIVAFLLWLGLPLLAIGRMGWALIREHPGHMLGEFGAAMRVFFNPAALLASRRRIRSLRGPGWAAVTPLRVDPKTVRTTRMIDREAILASQGRTKREVHFISNGGLTVFAVSIVVAIALTWWALAQTSLFGGGLAPLNSIGELWGNTRTVGGVPADPFTWVLAVLGSLTFWNPSHAIVLFLIAAIPLASLGGWMWAAGLTDSKAGRALVGLGWALSPVLLGSLGAGRLPTLVLAVALPWLLLAATRSRESWSWAGTASLLTAVVLACAPILIPAAVIFWVIGLATSVRGITRVLSIAIAPLALFAPKLLALFTSQPLDLLLDPGITRAYQPGTVWHLMLGFPEFGLDGWGGIFYAVGLGGAPATLLVGVLLLPIVLLGAVGLFTGKVHVTLLHAALGGLGLATAVAASHLQLVHQGAAAVSLWTGSGLALYWIALLGLAAIGCGALRRAAAPIVAVALVAALLAVAPTAWRLITNQTGITSAESQMPALVQAAGAANQTQHTLVLTADEFGAVRAELITGPGVRLDAIRTSALAAPLGPRDEWVAELVAGLIGTEDTAQLTDELAAGNVGFVLLRPDGDPLQHALLQAALDQHTVLASAGQTGHGLLWKTAVGAGDRVGGENSGDAAGSAQAAGPAGVGAAATDEGTLPWVGGTTLSGTLVWWVQLIVLLGMVLLALPTGEVVERPTRRRAATAGVARGGADPHPYAAPDAHGEAPAAVPMAAAGGAGGVAHDDHATSDALEPRSADPCDKRP